MKFHQYDVVRIVDLDSSYVWQNTLRIGRAPVIDDVATIVEIYEKPILGFELECCSDGETLWLETFSVNQVEFDLV